MKLQGVFMIIPLLAVVASGSTIPSKTSYNVQRLEKRGDDDPASKGYTAKNSRAKLAVVSDANGGAQSPTLAQHLSLAEQLEKIGERWTQVETELQGDIDQDKEKKRARLHNLGKESYKSQHGTPNYNRGDDERNWRDRPLFCNQAVVHESQHGTDNTVLEEIRKLNQELLKKQDEITNRGASNEKLSETQAQAIVQPKSIPHVNTVSISPILSSLKPSHGRSHGTKTVPEQIDDDYRKAVEEIEAIPFLVNISHRFLSVFLSHSFAHLVVECEQVADHRIQSGLVPAIQKSRLRLLGRALDPGVENVYTWLRGGVLNDEADLDQLLVGRDCGA
ncbi:hypothetical protein BASA84_001128 [Batrachochytrium salamandrivorans]|nr:hypothetical protein BASA84_001128 [Batrachochytrium salamandrivorans]